MSYAYRVGDEVELKIMAEIKEVRKYNDTLGMEIKFELINKDSLCCSLPVEFWGWRSDINFKEVEK